MRSILIFNSRGPRLGRVKVRIKLKANKSSQPDGINAYQPGIKLGANLARVTAMAAAICATVAVSPRPASASSENAPIRLAAQPPAGSEQDQNAATYDDDKEVPNSQVEKYINTYKAMQKDHGLTAEQAASKQGMTIAQFRSLEGRIERDDTLRERVRKALRTTNNPGAKDSADQ